jgi:2'-5' RNA ligase
MAAIERLASAGAKRISIGTALVRDRAFAREAARTYGDLLVADVAAKEGIVRVNGWREGAELTVDELVPSLSEMGYAHLVFTDIARDGMQTGIDAAAYARVAELAELLDDACAGFEPIPVSLGALGSFGKARRATLWQAVESDGGLEALADAIRKRLAQGGFSYDEKGFLAHMTLMRSADISRGELPMPQVARGSVEDVSLFKSDLSGKHPVYMPLHTVRLA